MLRLAPAAARNARDLLADAEILLERQRWPGAYALGVLAGEEAAKAYRCIGVLALGGQKVSRRDLERDHIGKLTVAHVLTDLVFPLVRTQQEPPTSAAAVTDRLEEMARQDNEAKKRGLYADIGPDGALRRPSDIGEAAARNFIASVTDLVAIVSLMTSEGTMQLLANPPAERLAELAPILQRVVEAHDHGGDDAVLTDQLRVHRARYSSPDPEPAQPHQIAEADESAL
jgi:AbiV family abortive infection protein